MPVGPLVWCYLKTTVPAKASSKSIPKDSFSKISEGVDLFAGGGDFGTLKKFGRHARMKLCVSMAAF